MLGALLQALILGVAVGAIYGLIAVGIVLVYKGSRVLNFAGGEFGTFALFIAWASMGIGLPYGVAAILAIASAAFIGFFFDWAVVRRMVSATRLSISVATVGLFILLVSLETLWRQPLVILARPYEGGGFTLMNFVVGPQFIIAFLAVIVVAVGLAAYFRYTDFGLGVLAASQDATAVRLVGVPLNRVSAFTWTMAGVMGAVAALLIQPIAGPFAPGYMTEYFVLGLAAALLGGLLSLPGAFVGGIALGVIESTVAAVVINTGVLLPGLRPLLVLIIVVAVLLIKPSGLLGREVGRPA